MGSKSWRLCVSALVCALLVLAGARAQDGKATDEGKAEDFKGKMFELKENGKAGVKLSFDAGTKWKVTVKSTGKADVNLFIYDAAKKEVAKDDSPGPDCEVVFAPKEAGKYTLVVVNKGPGGTSSTLKVKAAKGK
jgi:hypothetical protein